MEKLNIASNNPLLHVFQSFVLKKFAFIKQIQTATLKRHNTSTWFVSGNAKINSVQDLTNIHLQRYQSV